MSTEKGLDFRFWKGGKEERSIRTTNGRGKPPNLTEVSAYAKRGKMPLAILGVGLILGLPGSLSFGSNGTTDTEASRGVESAMDREMAELVKLYRLCLQKHEDEPKKAKENCGMYKDAIREFSPTNLRSIVGELLDGLRDNCEKAGNRGVKES